MHSESALDGKVPYEEECAGGACVKSHVLHCCHTATSVSIPAPRRGFWLHGWVCVDCKKTSRSMVLVDHRT